MQFGNSTPCWADAAGQLNSMLWLREPWQAFEKGQLALGTQIPDSTLGGYDEDSMRREGHCTSAKQIAARARD